MKITNENLRRSKKFVKKYVKKLLNDYFKKVEIEINEELPIEFKNDFIENSFENIYPRNVDELIKLKEKFSTPTTFLKECGIEVEWSGLDSESKEFIEKIVGELFTVTNEKGLGSNLWKYFTNIWQFGKVVQNFIKLDKNKLITETQLYTISQWYKTTYEHTIQAIIEYAYLIAVHKSSFDEESKKFRQKYETYENIGKTINFGELKKYCMKESFLTQNSCKLFNNSWLRDKIAHENYSFDIKNMKLKYGKKILSINDLKGAFQLLLDFNSYLVYKHLERSKFFENLKQNIESNFQNIKLK
jgi:hypothetical protein